MIRPATLILSTLLATASMAAATAAEVIRNANDDQTGPRAPMGEVARPDPADSTAETVKSTRSSAKHPKKKKAKRPHSSRADRDPTTAPGAAGDGSRDSGTP